jgi:hypothetical protein
MPSPLSQSSSQGVSIVIQTRDRAGEDGAPLEHDTALRDWLATY